MNGILDLVTAGSNGIVSTAAVRFGTGSGTFGAATTYVNDGGGAAGLELADLNGDGLLDMLVTGSGTRGGSGFVVVRLGSAQGVFGAQNSFFTTGQNPQAIALGDLNGDGVLDVVTTGSPLAGSDTVVDVSLGAVEDGINPLNEFSLLTKADSMQAMGLLDRTLTQLSKQRGTIGSFQSRLSAALGQLQSSREALIAATARITDADTAEQSAQLLRLQILQQAGAAVLANANQSPRLALALLRQPEASS